MPSQPMPVSTLSDVIRLVQAIFGYLGDGTPIMVGAAYLEEPGPGAPPRVVFVPDSEGKLGPTTKINAGYVASWTHGCRVHVRGVEPGDDPGRFEPVYLLAARVIDVLKACDPAHVIVGPGNPKDASPLAVDAPSGAEVVFTFAYVRNIAADPAVLRAARQITSVSPPDPDRPQGSTGKNFDVGTTASASRP